MGRLLGARCNTNYARAHLTHLSLRGAFITIALIELSHRRLIMLSQLFFMPLLISFELLCLLIELLCEHLFSLILFDQGFDVLKCPIFLRIRAQTHEVQQQF